MPVTIRMVKPSQVGLAIVFATNIEILAIA